MKAMNLQDLKKKNDLSFLEVFNQKESNHSVTYTANKLKQTEVSHHEGKAVRLVKNGRIGFASSYGKIDLEKIVSSAQKVSKFYPETKIIFPEKLKLKEEDKSNGKSNVLEMFKESGKEIIDHVLSSTGVDSLLVDVSFDVSDSFESLENTNDFEYSYPHKVYSFSVNLRETLETDFIEIFTASADSMLPDYIQYVNEAINLYKLSKKHAKIKNGSCPVLFTSRAAKDLLGIIEMALSGKQVNQKSSPWHNKIGQKVLSPLISIKQDPTFGYMARKIDDEGSKILPLSFVTNGILENFYYDLSCASNSELVKQSTGNGFRGSITSLPEPSLLNLIVSNGQKSFNELVKSVNYGLLVDQTMGGLTANISGDISMNIDLGFLIEKGEIVGRVKDTMISGNIYNALNNVLELSNNSKWYWSEMYNPDMLLDGFMVSSG